MIAALCGRARKKDFKMKRTLSLVLALALVFACVLSFASCDSFQGVYSDNRGNTWSFNGSKLKIETTIEVDKVSHDVVAIYSYKTTVSGETEKMTTELVKYKYSGNNAAVKEKVDQMNTYVEYMTDTAKLAEYTVTRDQNGAFINLTKSGVTTKLTLK